MSATHNVFDHRFLWVLNAKDCGGIDRIISSAQATGHGICMKWHDGDPSDDAKFGFQENFARVAGRCLPLGIPLLGWGYCYGDTYGNLAKEAEAVVDLLTRYPGAGYVIDAEGEYQVSQGRDWARRFGEIILSRVPDAKERLAYAPYWNLRYGHSLYPAKEFSAYCSRVKPQLYFDLGKRTTKASREKMFREMMEDYAPLGLPVCPVAEFSAGLSGVTDFLEIARAAGLEHWSWWLLDGYQESAEMRYLAELWAEEEEHCDLAGEVAELRGDVESLKRSIGYLLDVAARVKAAVKDI